MNWWTSVVGGAKSIGNGTTWIWNKVPITQTVAYVANSTFYVVEQFLALREAIPAVVTPPVMKIVKGAGNMLVYDVLPVVAAHYANNTIQNYLRPADPTAMLASYMIQPTLTLMNYVTWGITYRQASKLIPHTLVLDALGSSAFNEHKNNLTQPPTTLCVEEECNFKRKFKGSLREPIQLAFNDLMLLAISYSLPYGEEIAWVLAIYFYGEYITRMATPERCERHKAMKSESILSLGLAYTGTSYLMDQALEATVGLPPYLYLRTLRHLLLLAHINVASHMSLPLVRSAKDTIPLDPLVIYDRTKRFAIDVVFAGLMKRIPIDFKPPPGAKPFLPLSTVLRFLTRILDSDLEQVKVTPPGFFKKTAKFIIPSMFHSPKNAVNDPVIKQFWPDLRNDLLNILKIVNSAKPVKTLTTAPTAIAATVKYTLPVLLNYRFGLPIKMSEFLLSLSKKEDFWNFVTALERWLERNNVSYEVILAKGNSKVGLHETNQIIELPPESQTRVLPSANELTTPKTTTVTDAKRLISQKPSTILTANSLFTTKQRPRLVNNPSAKIDENSSSQPLQETSLEYNQ
ncbi:hypothetical protein OQJ15_13215 [Fluoribacter dumoffii]|uniref:Uncharacterized protein n=1 Tax=Fluoribacter dumoffii TaxID=463 RepID=A0A377G6H1_9GAMM|nr:hypothetical protein [Fluoribacter dumoffii]KTC91614.1 hypothetical protein Ldum_2682 [Fluoribacter dumoffii NY 23]MCW8387262.1 hypothetical protein [Fluoribacter dumoffii]MCW8497466.1 hypothetical protein [Fluoribacter dumoffii]STO20080.1 Uncharacterised protein [Fluoribacter dumoffii]